MKLKKAKVQMSKGTTKVTPGLIKGVVHIHHSQDVKLSIDYQSAGATYGVGFDVDKADLKEGIRFAERIVQTHLQPKISDLAEYLGKLGGR